MTKEISETVAAATETRAARREAMVAEEMRRLQARWPGYPETSLRWNAERRVMWKMV